MLTHCWPRSRLLLAAIMLVLAGCATRAPAPPGAVDGPPATPPPDLMQLPDALPVLEPIRAGGPNKPYAVLGESYTPLPADAALSESGLASWYGRKFHGRRTASGEVYDMYAMTAAHRTLPLPSFVRVSNPANGRSVIVRVNDRGPFVKDRVIDLSYSAAQKLGVFGVAPVELVRITPDEIRRGAPSNAAAAATPTPLLIDGDEPPSPTAPALALALALATTATAAENPSAQRGFWVQLGAFRERQGALQLRGQAGSAVEGFAPLLAVVNEQALYRVQAGPFASRSEAQRVADRLRDRLQIVPLVIERR